MIIIQRVIPGLVYCCHSQADKEEYAKAYISNPNDLKKGDLVVANTTPKPHDFLVGFVEYAASDHVIVREIGSDRLCCWSNEAFTKINKEILGYEILEGEQYKLYEKVLKAFSQANYWTVFKAISFDGNVCTVQAREKFKDETIFEVSFKYNSKTSIKSIVKLINDEETKLKNMKSENSSEL